MTDPFAEKSMPSNAEAEKAVLGSILITNQAMAQAAEELTPGDFYTPLHRNVFAAMIELYEMRKPIDPIMIVEILKRDGVNAGLSGTTITNLTFGIPMSADISEYVAIILKTRQMRDLIRVAGAITSSAMSGTDDYDEVLKNAQAGINEVCTQTEKQTTVHLGEVIHARIERVRQLRNNEIRATGVMTGFTAIDHLTGGLQPTDLIILGGRPGMGKTMFAGQLATDICKNNPERVGVIFSHEMSKEQLGDRFISAKACVEQDKIRSGAVNESEMFRIETSGREFMDFRIHVDDTSTLTANQMSAKLAGVRHRYGRLDFVVIDYLQRMSANRKTENRQQEVSAIARELKTLAKDLKVPVITLASLSRSCESREDKRPMLSDLRDSGDIESEADMVAFLYRASYYDHENASPTDCELIIAKHRNGPCRTIKLNFQREFTRFTNYEEIYHSAANV